MRVFHQARIRLTWWYVALAGALMLVFCALAYAALDIWLWRNLDASLQREWKWLADITMHERREEGPDWEEVWEDLEEQRSARMAPIAAEVRGHSGDVYFSYHVPSDHSLVLPSTPTGPYTIGSGPLRGYRAVTRSNDGYLLTVATSAAAQRSLLASVRWVFALAIPILLAVAGLVGWVFTRRALQPAHAAYHHMQRFMADAAHELRTPVTAIQGECDVALRRQRSEDEYREVLTRVRVQSDVIGRLVANLALLTRVDADQETLQLRSVRLGELVAEQVELARPAAVQRNIKIEAKIAESISVTGDDLRLRQLVANLLDNAIKFTDEGREVQVTLEQQSETAVLEVADTGPGISPEHIPHIFERFYRVDKSRSRERGGSGLGLSICKWIAEAHGGRIEVVSRLGEGSRFVVFIPLHHRA